MHYSIVDRGRYHLALVCAALIAASLAYGLTALAGTARAEGPGSGTPTTVSLGDSFISGEAGRWAGNTDESSSKTDTGSNAYYDNSGGTGETIEGCHRSKSAEVYIGSGVNGLNLACSGAKTSTFTSEGLFKPGIDFYNSGGHEGQALMLQHYAATHNVKLVALSIGGNNFNFAPIVTTCIEDFLESTIFWDFYCSEESSVTNNFTPANVSKVKGEIETAIKNVATAMTNAGYTSTQYTILVQNYPSPIPNGSEFRYTQSGYSRQTTGGCGFWNKDANYANATMLPTIDSTVLNAASGVGLSNVKTMELRSAFNSHRLCDKGVGLLEEEGLANWKASEAVNKSEWFNQIRTVETLFGTYQLQEDIHPNYWAQLGLRNCLTQAYNAGTPRGGTCTTTGSGLNSAGEPVMTLK